MSITKNFRNYNFSPENFEGPGAFFIFQIVGWAVAVCCPAKAERPQAAAVRSLPDRADSEAGRNLKHAAGHAKCPLPAAAAGA